MELVVAGGVGLSCELRGAGPTVALLNGIAMSAAHWKPVADALVAAGFSVLVHDFRGQLLSDKAPGPYSLALHARDLAALLDLLDIRKAALVGTSYGAEVALSFARDYPDRCSSLVLVDGASETDAVLSAAVESWKRAALADPALFYRVILPWNYSAAWLAENAAFVEKRAAAVAALPREYFDAFVRLCDAFLEIDLTKDLHAVRARTLVLVAEKDILKHRGFARIMADGIAGARCAEIAGAGHAVVIERPDEVARAAIAFLSEPQR